MDGGLPGLRICVQKFATLSLTRPHGYNSASLAPDTMPFPDDLLNPIEGNNPSGVSVRYDPVFEKIKEARREEDLPPVEMSEGRRKVADNRLVVELGTDLLSHKTKDLQLAVWITEALLKGKGFAGLRDGLALCRGLLDKFWDTLYPELEDGNPEWRADLLRSMTRKLEIPMRFVPLVERANYGFLDYQESRMVALEDRVKPEHPVLRLRFEKDGKVTPDIFETAFHTTSKEFYVHAEQEVDACLQNLNLLKAVCHRRFCEYGLAFSMI
jgi:type VI secretion system protein ImpA